MKLWLADFRSKVIVLYKINNSMILGVATWLEQKTGISATVIRIAFVVSVLIFGAGIGIYLILWLIKILSKE